MRILQNAAKRLNISMDRIYSNLRIQAIFQVQVYLFVLMKCIQRSDKKGDKIIIVGFGGGLTYGASLTCPRMINRGGGKCFEENCFCFSRTRCPICGMGKELCEYSQKAAQILMKQLRLWL